MGRLQGVLIPNSVLSRAGEGQVGILIPGSVSDADGGQEGILISGSVSGAGEGKRAF